MKYFVSLAISLSLLISSPAFSNEPEAEDTRTSLNLTETEKASFLAEMRQMLVSIQGVLQGIGENNPELIIKSAKYSGNRMARETGVFQDSCHL